MRVAQFLVGQAGTLGAEQYGHRGVLGLRHRAPRRLAHIEHAKILIAFAAGGRQHQAAAVQRGCQIRLDPRPRQQVLGARGAGTGLRMRELPRPHQHQLLELHVLERARRRADVAGMRGLDQDDANWTGHDLLS